MCDLRFRGGEYLNARLVEFHGPNRARFLLTDVPGFTGPFDVVLGPYIAFEWRPIPVPDGVPAP